MVKGIILLNMIYPVPLKNEEVLTDLMVDLSLKIWDTRKHSKLFSVRTILKLSILQFKLCRHANIKKVSIGPLKS